MINLISKSIARFFAQKNIISYDELDTYTYGYEIIFITLINWSVIILIMLLTQKFTETLFYILPINVIRKHTGGYHANTHAKCFILSVLMYVCVLLITITISEDIYFYIIFLNLSLSSILILKLAPIEHINNPVNKIHIKKNRLYSRVYTFLIIIIAIIILQFGHKTSVLCLSLGMLQVSVLLCIEYIKNLRRKSYES